MSNNHKKIFKFIENNNLEIDCYMLRILENMDLTNPETLSKAKKIRKRYDNENSKYPEDVMCQLRQRLGLDDKYDTSLDEKINNMSRNDVFGNLLSWNGLIGWDLQIKKWINFIYNIDLDKE